MFAVYPLIYRCCLFLECEEAGGETGQTANRPSRETSAAGCDCVSSHCERKVQGDVNVPRQLVQCFARRFHDARELSSGHRHDRRVLLPAAA